MKCDKKNVTIFEIVNWKYIHITEKLNIESNEHQPPSSEHHCISPLLEPNLISEPNFISEPLKWRWVVVRDVPKVKWSIIKICQKIQTVKKSLVRRAKHPPPLPWIINSQCVWFSKKTAVSRYWIKFIGRFLNIYTNLG